MQNYFQKVMDGMEQINKQEALPMKQAALKITESIENGGVLHVFGCGHSHMIAEEMFYRAGGLATINPILVEKLMLHEGAVRSSMLEKQEGLGSKIVNEEQINDQDIMLVVSNSGRNAVPIDAAMTAKEKGCFVIGLTSTAYRSLPSRHKSKKHLSEHVDLVLDNHVPIGDAVMSHQNVAVPYAPVSTIFSSFIVNTILTDVIDLLGEAGKVPPVFMSGNVDDENNHNDTLILKYRERIPLLTKNG
ncbi:SIS domain-containing protein [Alkalihalobacillus sp. LMS39]|uniref:SIS domain-containing protein n=1 Tax=Alkalihalobacillus sp. LMS39 TaxID=2924032 RepID=UPI001FB53D68|nr:SIS domain-containing protein [Alkalihalobacillus sp. LMS39]UOE93771.1 SIS domain-containing protein [Alkalihalobacillus sp. LMS39]